MTTETDHDSRAAVREDVFSALDGLEPGESMTITGAAADVVLHQYQFSRGRRLQWESAAGEADSLRVEVLESLGEEQLLEFDVRDMPPQRRHEVLTETFDLLDPGRGFVLVNDHDPKPLYHELQSTRGDVFDWEDLSRDPAEWKVAIEKTAEAAITAGEDVMARFDVRKIPKPDRHPTIHHRYGNVPVGESIEIVAPHEPTPLRREFQQRYGDAFEWDVREQEPGRCRVRITKTESASGGPAADAAAADAESAGVPTDAGGDSPEVVTELDVRDRPPAQRHEAIYDAYADLDAGEGFVLVNDHDPKPLYHQFDAEAGDEFYWKYRQKEAGEFEVLIGKREDVAGESSPSGAADAPF